MRSRSARALVAGLAAFAATTVLPAPPAGAAGFDHFLHGGRATGQVGAFVARADDPSAVRYNPAGLVNTEDWELQLGVDFSNATDEFTITSGLDAGTTFRADHSIQFPPSLYLSWSGDGPWAWGIGVDTPYWYRVDFDPVFFPDRFRSRVIDVELWEVHPAVAYDLGAGWSLGGGVRYLYGSFEQGINSSFGFGPDAVPVELLLDTDTDVDGYGWEVGTQFRTVVWGFGASYRSATEVDGSGDLVRRVRDAPPGFEDELADLIDEEVAVSQSLDLPSELAAGFWFAPYPELRVELDLVLTGWGDFQQTFEQSSPLPGETTAVQRSGWDDTTSIRLGVEGDVTDALALGGGVAWEPSPIPGNRIDPAFFRGDATVYAVGLTYSFPQLSFDLGYSFHDYDNRGTTVVDRTFPVLSDPVDGRYSTRDQQWSVSARWRF